MIPQTFIDDLIARIDLPSLIGEHIDINRKGAGYEGCCPFHDEKTPSFKVFSDHYHCFGCGAHGNAIGFLTDKLGMTFPNAVRVLADRECIPVEDDSLPRRDIPPHNQDVFDTLSRACANYQQILFMDSANPAVIELERRGIDTDLAVRYGLGYAPEQWGTLSNDKAFRHATLVEAGLSAPRPNGKGVYDRFRHRLMFPIIDLRGRTIGFGGRRLGDDGPKYLNSPETSVYHKTDVLFGLHQAKASIRRANHVVVAEGYFDVVTPAQHGIENVASTCGTALTEIQAELLLSVADRLTLCFDGDAAGNKATWAASALLVPRVNDGHEIRICRLPDGHDPDSLVRERGPQAFLDAIADAPTLVDYLAAEIARGARSAEARSRATYAAIAQWRNFSAPAMRIFFRQAVCVALGMSEHCFDQLAADTAIRAGDAALRHCPFCGSGAVFVPQGDLHAVHCSQCGISTPTMPTKEQAQNLWNRRDRSRHAA